MEELNYHVDFGQFYVHLTRKQKKYLAVRSVIDRILAALALIVLSPLFLVVSVAQKISAPDEPIFFLQKRVGRGAHCFNIIKFRTMKSSAPKNVATGDLESPETYISRLGRFLRDTSIDELPQFFNVLGGSMSLVGTRPPTPDEVEKYGTRQWRRISIKPGLTGMWQVNGRSLVTDFEKIVELDVEYIDNWSLMEDIRILCKTVTVLLKHADAY